MSEPISMAFLGKVIGGAASGWFAMKQKEDEQDALRAQEERKAAQYRGLGRPAGESYWEDGQGEQQKQGGGLMQQTAVGTTEGKVGQKYIERARRNRSLGPRYQFDETTKKLKYG